jgi:hypothetical protein
VRPPERLRSGAVRIRLALGIAIAIVLGTAPPASARATHTLRATVDFTGTVLACPAENVIFSGSATLTETATSTPTGKSVAHLLVNLQGLTAVGDSSGAKYRVVGVTSTGFGFSIGTPQTADTSRFTQTWLLVPLDGGAPLSFREVLTIVHNANGDLVALVSHPPADCS